MRVRWDEAKRQRVLAERDIDFEQLNDLLYTPYLEDQRSELPEQYRIIGFTNLKLTTFIVEYRDDEVGGIHLGCHSLEINKTGVWKL